MWFSICSLLWLSPRMRSNLQLCPIPYVCPVRYVGGLLLHELLRALPDVFAANAAAVLPLAFSAKMDDDKEAAAVWKEV